MKVKTTITMLLFAFLCLTEANAQNESCKNNDDMHDSKMTSHFNKFDLFIPFGIYNLLL